MYHFFFEEEALHIIALLSLSVAFGKGSLLIKEGIKLMSTNASTFHSPLVCPLFTRKLNTLYQVQSSTMRTKADWRLYSEGPSHKVHLKSRKEKGQPWDSPSRRATERESYVLCRHRRRSFNFFPSKILWLKRQNWLTNDFNSCITFYTSLFSIFGSIL